MITVENNDEYVGHSKTNILSKAVKLKESFRVIKVYFNLFDVFFFN